MGAPRVAVVDYHKGNLLSVERGLLAAGAHVLVTDDPAAIASCDAAVVPGVGAFADAMEYMAASGQAQAVRDLAAAGRPVLGICLGMQLFFERGNEHAALPEPGQEPPWAKGLGLMRGEVVRFPAEPGLKVPHVGWNSAELTAVGAACPLFKGVGSGAYFYYTHSYLCVPADASLIAATTLHGGSFPGAVWDGGCVFGTQFHPEKSSSAGELVMGNFVSIAKGER